ncbi:hypothetical protein RJ641_022260 [Dillenia turbinata]|uniref:Uncharacterized protein n=1 Tax=Dillenia turbinata TaxID=194707 RepID=A0AAN8YRI9_9MAGN
MGNICMGNRAIVVNNYLTANEVELKITVTPAHDLIVRNTIKINSCDSAEILAAELYFLETNPERHVLVKLSVNGFYFGLLFLGSELARYDVINIRECGDGKIGVSGVKHTACKLFRSIRLGQLFGWKYAGVQALIEEEEMITT